MSKSQFIALAFSSILFCVLYFGFDTKPKGQNKINKARAMVAETTDISILVKDAKKKLSPEDAANILALETEFNQVKADSSRKIEVYKRISALWYQFGQPDISGHYAEEIADIINDEDSWSITGTTYSICMQQMDEKRIKDYCYGRAIKAFENAISLNPDNKQHQVNLALCFSDNPPKDNPMKGVLMLLDLNKKNPNNIAVLVALGRLGIRTGQFEKAKQRLLKVLDLSPLHRTATCLLVEVFQGLGNAAESGQYLARCKQLN